MSDPTLHIAEDFPPVFPETWRALVEKGLKGKPFETLVTKLESGLQLQPLYTRKDSIGENASGIPGRGELGWLVCQEYDEPDATTCTDAMATDLARGVDAVWLRTGADDGVRVRTAGDLAEALRDVDLGTVAIHLEPGLECFGVAAGLYAVADGRPIPRASLHGCLGADPLGILARFGKLSTSLETAFDQTATLARLARRESPQLRALLISSRPYADAGAAPVHELAWTIATGIEMLRALAQRGLSVDDVSGQMLFALSVGNGFFYEIARLRAARLLWAKVVTACGGSAEARRMRLHARTSRYTANQRDPWVNMIRATTQSFAAAVGGADSITTDPFDATLGGSDDFSRRIAAHTQTILSEESHVVRVGDPAGGSWYVERLTDEIARAAWNEIQRIESLGGVSAALIAGEIQKTVLETRTARTTAVQRRKTPIVGVSEFPCLDEDDSSRPTVDLDRIDAALGRGQGDESAVTAALDRVAKADGDARAAAAIGAATAGANLAAITSIGDSGTAVEVEALRPARAAEAFESLRDAADRAVRRTGRRPTAFLANLGTLAQHMVRATWVRNALAAGGIDAVDCIVTDPTKASTAYSSSGCDMVVICGPDDLYPTSVPALAEVFKNRCAKVVAVAGRVGDHEAAFREAGVDLFLVAGADLHAALNTIHEAIF